MTTETLKPWNDSASSFSLDQGLHHRDGRCEPLNELQATRQIRRFCQHSANSHAIGRPCEICWRQWQVVLAQPTVSVCHAATSSHRPPHHTSHSLTGATQESTTPKARRTFSRCCHVSHPPPLAADPAIRRPTGFRFCCFCRSAVTPLARTAAPPGLHALHSLPVSSSCCWAQRPRRTYQRRQANIHCDI